MMLIKLSYLAKLPGPGSRVYMSSYSPTAQQPMTQPKQPVTGIAYGGGWFRVMSP